jgi:hypothetical protein
MISDIRNLLKQLSCFLSLIFKSLWLTLVVRKLENLGSQEVWKTEPNRTELNWTELNRSSTTKWIKCLPHNNQMQEGPGKNVCIRWDKSCKNQRSPFIHLVYARKEGYRSSVSRFVIFYINIFFVSVALSLLFATIVPYLTRVCKFLFTQNLNCFKKERKQKFKLIVLGNFLCLKCFLGSARRKSFNPRILFCRL